LVVLLQPVHGWSSVHERSSILIGAARLLHVTPVRLSDAAGGTLVHVSSGAPTSPSSSATPVAAHDVVVREVGPAVPHRLLQLDGARSPDACDRLSDRLQCHQPHNNPPRSHLPTQASFVCPPLSVMVLSYPSPQKATRCIPDLLTSTMSLSLLSSSRISFSIRWFTTSAHWCMLARNDSTCPLYTLPLPTSTIPTPRVIPYALAAAASSATWHRRLGHPGPNVLSMLSSSSAITFPRGRDDSLCHACQLGRHIWLPFPSSSSRVVRPFDLLHCDLWTSPVLSVSGYKYYLVILDDFTHYS
jgi:hypothetical protein